ncbi:unnamed protein product [Vicia faba]|uniref:CSN8/PSMD8/EIF3K domain-containing protein n=1 Tax=Vicia faba TaxID=3906 RepID=A0AAV0ZLK8_VICFA|nr:unnamed protein product [Vicia faba]
MVKGLGVLFGMHFKVHDINSARFLWKTIPSSIKESKPEITAVWKIGQQLWLRNYGGVHEAIRGYEWSQELQGFISAFSELYTKEVFQLLVSAYSTISIEDAALFLGMSKDDATSYVLQQCWTVDSSSGMLTVQKQPVVTEQKLDPRKLHQLTKFHSPFNLSPNHLHRTPPPSNLLQPSKIPTQF